MDFSSLTQLEFRIIRRSQIQAGVTNIFLKDDGLLLVLVRSADSSSLGGQVRTAMRKM